MLANASAKPVSLSQETDADELEEERYCGGSRLFDYKLTRSALLQL